MSLLQRNAAGRASAHILPALWAECDDHELPGMRLRARGGLEVLPHVRAACRGNVNELG